VKSVPSRRYTRGNPLLREQIHDPYRSREKLQEATRCPQCGIRYRNGRWTWPKTQTSAFKSHLCPACRRTNEHCPAGELVISGSFAAAHREEILGRVRHVEEAERNQHPLHRIMAIEQRGAKTVVTTTDIHLPHCIGHALKDAWGGTLRTQYDLEGYFTRVRWQRNDA